MIHLILNLGADSKSSGKRNCCLKTTIGSEALSFQIGSVDCRRKFTARSIHYFIKHSESSSWSIISIYYMSCSNRIVRTKFSITPVHIVDQLRSPDICTGFFDKNTSIWPVQFVLGYIDRSQYTMSIILPTSCNSFCQPAHASSRRDSCRYLCRTAKRSASL